jgi:ferredoxin
LEQNSDIDACLAKLSRVPDPVLGCIRTREHSNAALACLGGLSEEHLLALCHSMAGELTLNLSACADCPNSAMITCLRLRLSTLSGAELLDGGCCMRIADAAQDIHYLDESVDRRGFFNAFRTALFKSADIVLSSTNDKTERRIEYAVKRVPIRRALLNRSRNTISQELAVRLRKHFDSCVSRDETCTACQGCVAICPTGALQTASTEESPVFEQRLCTGCRLCQEFCLDGAVRMRTSYGDEQLPRE